MNTAYNAVLSELQLALKSWVTSLLGALFLITGTLSGMGMTYDVTVQGKHYDLLKILVAVIGGLGFVKAKSTSSSDISSPPLPPGMPPPNVTLPPVTIPPMTYQRGR